MKEYRRIADWREAAERAELIFTRWLEAGKLESEDIRRVFAAQYNYYVTFTRNDQSVGARRGGYVTIESPNNISKVIEMAQEKYGSAFEDLVAEYDFDPRKYPVGEIARLTEKGEPGKVRVTVDQ